MAGLAFWALLAASQAAEPPRELARQILSEMGADVEACPQEAAALFPDREMLCTTYSKEYSFFKLDWETTLGRHDLRTRVEEASPWTLRQGSYVRDYEAADAKLTVSFDERTGRLLLAFTLPDDGAEAALATAALPSSARDEPPTAGFGGVSFPVLIAESRVEPVMPERAATLDMEGQVTLRLLVLRDGSVGKVRVLRVEPEGWGFEEAAVAAIEQWRFEPARQEGAPVDVWFTVLHDFPPR